MSKTSPCIFFFVDVLNLKLMQPNQMTWTNWRLTLLRSCKFTLPKSWKEPLNLPKSIFCIVLRLVVSIPTIHVNSAIFILHVLSKFSHKIAKTLFCDISVIFETFWVNPTCTKSYIPLVSSSYLQSTSKSASFMPKNRLKTVSTVLGHPVLNCIISKDRMSALRKTN